MKFSNLIISAVSTVTFLIGPLGVSALPEINGALELSVIGTYRTGIYDEGAAEIVAHDPCYQRLFVVNGFDKTIDILNILIPENPTRLFQVTLPSGFDPTCVVFLKDEQAIAVSAGNSDGSNGKVFFYDVDVDVTDGETFSSTPIYQVEVGNLPDMLIETPDGKYILTANEGERRDSADPAGSVSIIDVASVFKGATKKATVGFANLDTTALKAKGVRIAPGYTAEFDLEPEYIAVDPDSEFAFVALQENNAVIKIKIADFAKALVNPASFSFKVADVLPLGYQDYSETYIDPTDRDFGNGKPAVTFRKQAGIYGIRMPDATVAFEAADKKVYFATANEGDTRDDADEERIKDVDLDEMAFPNAATLQTDQVFGRLTISSVDGDLDGDSDFDQLYAFGARSFSIFDVNGVLVFDSGNDFEFITFGANPEYFNSDHAEAKFDDRSDNKGPEPEGIAIGEIEDRIYAFIGLERVGGIMVYDITVPAESFFVTYINNRNFIVDQETAAAGDLGPEGLKFIKKEDSPTGNYMLVVGNEVSGTTTLFDIAVVGGVCANKRRGLVRGEDHDLEQSQTTPGKLVSKQEGRTRNLTPKEKKGASKQPKCGKRRA